MRFKKRGGGEMHLHHGSIAMGTFSTVIKPITIKQYILILQILIDEKALQSDQCLFIHIPEKHLKLYILKRKWIHIVHTTPAFK